MSKQVPGMLLHQGSVIANHGMLSRASEQCQHAPQARMCCMACMQLLQYSVLHTQLHISQLEFELCHVLSEHGMHMAHLMLRPAPAGDPQQSQGTLLRKGTSSDFSKKLNMFKQQTGSPTIKVDVIFLSAQLLV